MSTVGSIHRFILTLFACFLVCAVLQPQEHGEPDKSQRIAEINRELEDLREQLKGVADPERRQGIEEDIERLERERDDLEREGPGDHEPGFFEFIADAIKNPIVLAALIGAIGAIIAALIGIKRRK